MAKYEELTDEQWEVVSAHLPVQQRRLDGKGRPRKGRS